MRACFGSFSAWEVHENRVIGVIGYCPTNLYGLLMVSRMNSLEGLEPSERC